MTQALQVFNFKGDDLRTVVVDGQPWWAARDVCDVLGIRWKGSGSTGTLARLLPSEKSAAAIETAGGPQVMATISETGLYKLVMRSDKPEAAEFQTWAAGVLATIRATGSYSLAPVDDPIGRMAQALERAFPVIAGQIQTAQATADEAKAIAEAAPTAALEAMKREQADASKLRGVLAKKVAVLADEACNRGFFEGNRRRANQSINGDIRERFGVRDGMPSDVLRLAVAYVDERHAKLTSPNRMELGA
jgi:prophage antirepressor-like protein